jgi:hypothetical protein
MPLATRERPPASPALNEILEAEQTVIGRILRDDAEYRAVARFLKPDDFTERLHWGVFAEVGALIEAGKPATIAAILPRLPSVGLGGVLANAYLEKLVAKAPSTANLRHLAEFLASAARERRSKPPDGAGYEEDLYLWANQQAEHLRRGDWSRLNALNLAEEIEDLGREVYTDLEGRFRIILLHLLKWDHRPHERARGWTASIEIQRIEVEDLLQESPSLRWRVPEAIAHGYHLARIEASGETDLDEDVFPNECPYSFDDIMTRPIPWPRQ